MTKSKKVVKITNISWREIVRKTNGQGTITMNVDFQPFGFVRETKFTVVPRNCLCSDCKEMQPHYFVYMSVGGDTRLAKVVCPIELERW